jgi:EmrB/QacA subfamily drug resistance transporter
MPLSVLANRHAAARTATRRQANPGTALAASLLGFFVITLDASVVNVALPAMRAGLGGGITGLQWVVDGYVLAFAALLLSAGSFSDRVGARRAFAVGLTVFVAASAACGLAPSLPALVVARLVQGAGAAMMMPSSLALIREAYTDAAQRGRALALWSVGGALAAAAGPVTGGALSLVSWRMIFFVNLPVGAIALLLLARVAGSPRREAPFDWTGQAAAVIAMGALTYGVIEAGSTGWRSPEVVIAFAVTAAAAADFARSQRRGKHPMLPLDLVRTRVMAVSAGTGFAFLGGFQGMVFVYSLYLQQERGMSAFASGLTFVPMTVLSGFTGVPAARLAERFGPRVPIIGGMFFMGVGLLALAAAPATTPMWALALLMLPVGLSGPMAIPVTTAVLLDNVPPHRSGIASGVFNTSRQVGAALAVAVFGGLLASHRDLLPGLRESLAIAAGVALVATAANLLLPHAPTGRPPNPRKEAPS